MRDYLRCIAAVIFLAVSAYLIAAFVQAQQRPETATVRTVRISDDAYAEGEVVCISDYLTAPFEAVYCTASEGSWVSGGEVVAVAKEDAAAFFDGKRPRSSIIAPCAGYFSRVLDKNAPENAVGRIISGGWRFVTKLHNAGELHTGQRLELTVYDTYPAVVEAIDGERVTILCKSGLSAVYGMQRLNARLCFADLEGLRVPESAICADKDGKFVYILAAGVKKRAAVEVIYKKSDLCLVRSTQLCDGMQVILKQGE